MATTPAVYDDGEAFCEGDDQVDWSNVDELAAEYERINSIENPIVRLEEAQALAARLNGDG